MSRGQTSLAQPMHVPGGGLGLSVVGAFPDSLSSSSKSIGTAGPLWVHKKTVQESVHDACVYSQVQMWRNMLWAQLAGN